MSHSLFAVGQGCALLSACLALFPVNGATAAPPEQPNFVIIFTDDQGYGDVGCYGAEGFETPALDRMAAEGMRFTDFTVADCVCTPSRGSLLTGRYPKRWGHQGGVYFPRSNGGMSPREITIAEVLKPQGYATAIVGKWHLGHKPPFLPTNQGFDSYFGIPYSNDMSQDGREPVSDDIVFNDGMTLEEYHGYRGDESGRAEYRSYAGRVPMMRDTEIIEWPVDQAQITRRFTEEAQTFIRANKDKPFFLYLAHSMPHTPLFASERFKGKTERGLYGDVIEEIDWSVGEILKTLRESGLAKKTFVVFTTDNGPWLIRGDHGGSSGPLRDGKGSSYEGGQRVPCIMWWPESIPAGTVCDVHVASMDLMPTLAHLAGTPPPRDRVIDGLDMREVLKGNFSKAPQREFYLYARKEAIRVGDWKYRKGKEYGSWARKAKKKKNPVVVQLFNLKDDFGEKNNLAEKYPEKVAELARRLETEYAEVAAKNPDARDMAEALFKAVTTGKAVPPLSVTAGRDLDIDEAYTIQERFNARMQERFGKPSGYKVAFSAKPAQDKFGITTPAFGTFFQKQRVETSGSVKAADFIGFVNEAEIAFTIGKDIRHSIATIEDLMPYIASVHVGLDVPDIRFDTTAGTMTAGDVIAMSCATHTYVLGEGVSPGSVDYKNTRVTLSHDGDEVYAGDSSNVLGDPRKAVLMLNDHLLAHGSYIKAGDVVLSGSVGKPYTPTAESRRGIYVGKAGGMPPVKLIVE